MNRGLWRCRFYRKYILLNEVRNSIVCWAFQEFEYSPFRVLLTGGLTESWLVADQIYPYHISPIARKHFWSSLFHTDSSWHWNSSDLFRERTEQNKRKWNYIYIYYPSKCNLIFNNYNSTLELKLFYISVLANPSQGELSNKLRCLH